jgi:RNA polymerase sigma factor for flagellar operon FliA
VERDRDHLVTDNVGLVHHAVNQMASRYPRHIDRDELWNAGALGLVDAARRFDPDQGIPFSRYAMIRIRGAIIDSTRSRDWATRATRRSIREVRNATDALQAEHGRAPTDLEVAEHLDIPVEQLSDIRTAAVTAKLLHLDQHVGQPDTDEVTLGDLLEEHDEEVLPGAALENRELTGTLRVAIEHLPEVQREVVTRYYFGNEYLRDIADSLGVTEARASQIRSEGLSSLRAHFGRLFDGVPEVVGTAPGRRNRAAFLADMAETTSWRDCMAAADAPAEAVLSLAG